MKKKVKHNIVEKKDNSNYFLLLGFALAMSLAAGFGFSLAVPEITFWSVTGRIIAQAIPFIVIFKYLEEPKTYYVVEHEVK